MPITRDMNPERDLKIWYFLPKTVYDWKNDEVKLHYGLLDEFVDFHEGAIDEDEWLGDELVLILHNYPSKHDETEIEEGVDWFLDRDEAVKLLRARVVYEIDRLRLMLQDITNGTYKAEGED